MLEVETTAEESKKAGFSRDNPIIHPMKMWVFEDGFMSQFNRRNTVGDHDRTPRYSYIATEQTSGKGVEKARSSSGIKSPEEAIRTARYHLEDPWQNNESGEWHRSIITEVIHEWPPVQVFLVYMDRHLKGHYLTDVNVAKFLEDVADREERRAEEIDGRLAHRQRIAGRRTFGETFYDHMPPMLREMERRMSKRVVKRCRKAAKALLDRSKPYTWVGSK